MRLTISTLIAAALMSVAVAPAIAQSLTCRVDIDGSVAPRCLFTTASATISVGELALTGTGANAGRLDATKLDGQTRNLVGW